MKLIPRDPGVTIHAPRINVENPDDPMQLHRRATELAKTAIAHNNNSARLSESDYQSVLREQLEIMGKLNKSTAGPKRKATAKAAPQPQTLDDIL